MKWRLSWRAVRFWWQRRTRGWDDSDWWSLDHTIAKFVLPRLEEFRERTITYPALKGAETMEGWRAVLDDMIFAMRVHADGTWEHYEDSEEDWERTRRGEEAFGKWFSALWD